MRSSQPQLRESHQTPGGRDRSRRWAKREATILTTEQERIYAGLVELVSAGTADLYFAACEIRNSDPRPRAAALSVGHFLREVDSAVRHALTPHEPVSKSKGQNDGHEANIGAVLAVLEVPLSDPRVALWRNFSNKKDPWHLTNFAHRRGLGGTRPFDTDFEALCAEFDALLTFLLDRIRASATKLTQKLNELLSIQVPTAENIKTLRNNVPAAPFIFDRLFDVRLTANWIDGLLDAGFFADLPPGAPTPAAMFAMRLSETDSDRACKILEQIPTVDNVFMGNAYVSTMQRLARHAYPALFVKTLAWVESFAFDESVPHLYPQFSNLIVHLGACGDVERVLALTGALTIVTRPSSTTNPFFCDPESALDIEEYDDVLGSAVETLSVREPLALVTLFCDRLETVLDITFDQPMPSPSGNQDVSESWFANFDDPQAHIYSLKQVILKRLAEVLTRAAAADSSCVTSLAYALKGRPYRVFRRLEAYLLLHAGNGANDLADAMVCDARNFWSIAPEPEFGELLRRQFPRLEMARQQDVLKYITADLDPGTISEDASEDDRSELGGRRIKNYLTLLTGHLPEAYDDRLAQLTQTYGASTDLISEVYEPTHAIGPGSPRTNERFDSLSAMETADALLESPFELGAAERLRDAIADDPGRFVSALGSFERLGPRYVRYIVLGFSLALRRGNPFNWAMVIDFAHHVVAGEALATGSDSEVASTWSSLRNEVCTLIIDGTTEEFPTFDRNSRETALAIIERVFVDEPPTAATETPADFGSALTRSFGDVRASALRALIGAILLFRDRPPHPDLEQRDSVRTQSDASTLLLRFLAAQDLPTHVHAGERFDLFCRLDLTWARSVVALIFPTTEIPESAKRAAWETFITVSRPMLYSYRVLESQYALAARVWPIDETKRTNPDFSYPSALAIHVLVLFVYGELSLDADLAPFYARLTDKAAARAIFRIADYFRDPASGVGDEHIARFMQFWAWRKTQFADAPEQHIDEIKSFGWCFCTMKLPERWALDELKLVLSLTDGAVAPSHRIMECLREISDGGLPVGLECLILLIEGRTAVGNVYFWADDIRSLLLRAHAVNATLARTSREIAGRLTAKRVVGFDALF